MSLHQCHDTPFLVGWLLATAFDSMRSKILYHKDGVTGQPVRIVHVHIGVCCMQIGFTGSTAVGKLILAEAAGTMKSASLECGGKNPLIICADANIDEVGSLAMSNQMRSSVWSCMCQSTAALQAAHSTGHCPLSRVCHVVYGLLHLTSPAGPCADMLAMHTFVFVSMIVLVAVHRRL